MSDVKERYFVAAKLFLRDKEKLLILHDIFGSWDLPGGRYRPEDFGLPFSDIAKRKVIEELGDQVRFELGELKVFFQVERIEASSGETVRIFAVGFEATFKGGDIQLGKHMEKMEWVEVRTFEPEKYFKGGWLTGVQEYLKAVNLERKH